MNDRSKAPQRGPKPSRQGRGSGGRRGAASGKNTPRPPKPKRSDDAGRAKPQALTTYQRSLRAVREIEGLARAICKDLGVAGRDDLPLEEVIVPVAVRLDPRGGAKEFAERLRDSLTGRIYEAVKSAIAFRPGHVYCFACDEPTCACSLPDDPRETFVGYTPTGRPVWKDFGNLCLELKHPKVDRLYGPSSEILVVSLSGDQLTGELLDGFGRDSRTYRVLAQIVAGYLPDHLKPKSDDDDARRVLTLQIVETSAGQREKRVRLNVLGLVSDDLVEMADRDPAGPAEALRQLVGATRQRLGSASRTLAERQLADPLSVDALKTVEPIVTRLRSDLARALKPVRYRTDHAAARHREGDRPTASAVSDARRAPDHALLRDMRRDTVIVIGPRGRAHVFNEAGRHVTSLTLVPGELDKKSHQGRWRPLKPHEISTFRATLADG